MPKWLQILVTSQQLRRGLRLFRTLQVRFALAFAAALIVITEAITIIQPYFIQHTYAMGNAEGLLPQTNQLIAQKLQFDIKNAKFNFNAGFNPTMQNGQQSGGPQISAALFQDASKGITVTDPANQVDFVMKPQFSLLQGKQQDDRVIYPLSDGTGWLVYTMQGVQVKEDVLLSHANGDKMVMNYTLGLGTDTEARMLPNGSVGVYGSSLPLYGNVATGTDKDKTLLEKARQKAPKNALLFVIPAPVVHEYNKESSGVKAVYKLEGNHLQVVVDGLKKARYPLTIDPSVYVESAAKFMRGNNESNTDFDTTNELIQKGRLTGARIPSWTSTTALNAGLWNQGNAVGGGFIYAVGGSSGSSNVSTVYWAKLNASTQTIDSPTPGVPAALNTAPTPCTNWCTSSSYNLPSPRSGLSVVIYNTYMYAIGGQDASCTTGNGTGNSGVCSTVYVAKIGANGEPISWSTTTALTAERKFAGAVAYNNRIYLMGGQTSAATGGVTTAEYAAVNPDGTLGSWTSTTALPTARWGHTSLEYNGYVYLLGGANGTTVQNSVQFVKIKSDGTFASSWVSNTTNLPAARATLGGTFVTISGGFMYVTGGCSAVSATNCTTIISSDTLQLSSINADGTTNSWDSLSGITQTRTGFGFLAWRNALYVVGGCGAATSSGNCASALTTTNHGTINNDGDVAPTGTENSLPVGTGTTQVGGFSEAVVVSNGYIYSIGGCTGVGTCTTMSVNSASAPINSDGSLGSWTVDNTGTLPAGGIGAAGVSVYDNFVYLVGGTTGASSAGWKNTITYASLNTDGTIGTWTTTASLLNGGTAYGYSAVFTRVKDTTHGNLYIVGGCQNTSSGVGCSNTFQTAVLKCSILNSSGAPSGCATTGELQLQDLDASTAGSQGFGIMGYTQYGDYLYMAGGSCGTSATGGATQDLQGCDGVSTSTVNTSETDKVIFAKINSSGDIVRADNGATTGGWQISSNRLPRVRRRNVAYAVNGYLYVTAGHDGSDTGVATLSDIVYAKIDQTTGNIGAFTSLATTITPRWNLGAVTANGYIYIIGGCTDGAPPNGCTNTPTAGNPGTVESVQVYNNASGSPRQYSAPNLFTTDRYGSGAVAYNGELYIVGGCSGTVDCEASPGTATFQGDSQYADIAADGTLTWHTGPSLPSSAVRGFGCLVAQGGYLYYMGGRDTTTAAYSTIYYSQLSGGVPGAWGTATKAIGDTGSGGQARLGAGCATFNNHIYVVGGANATPTQQTTVYESPSLPSGGDITSNWTSTTAFTTARSGATLIAYGGTLYLLGGYDGTNFLLDTQYASINSDGSINSWSPSISLPQPVRQGSGFAANGYLYLFGGRSAATTCTNTTYVAPIIGYTAGSTTRYGLGLWSQSNVTYTGNRYGVAAAYYNGRTYLLGGFCNATLTAANSVVYSTLQAQPQISSYSLEIDTDGDVFPSKWLMNGVDNGTGAQWVFSYYSSTNANDSWGQVTNVGAVTLGTPGTYTPIDGSGASTATVGARYYYFYVTVDASQAFGFPEDVSRGPTIADITLEFSTDPGKRLIHGTTFTGGVKQPLDTPF